MSGRLAFIFLVVGFVNSACGDDVVPEPETFTLEAQGLEPALLAIHPVGESGELLAVGGPLAGDGPPALRYRAGGAWRDVSSPAGWRGAAWWTWSASPDEVWVVGDRGQAARGSVDALTLEPTGTSTHTVFYGVWGSGPDDVWLVGGSARAPGGPYGVILRWDGASFTEVTPTGTASVALDNALFKVWGTGPDHVVVVGTFGVAIEYDGQTWTRTETGVQQQLTTVHGRAPNDVYAVGGFNQGVVLHYDGAATWRSIGERFAPPLSGVFAADDGRVWVAGDSGYLASWDGAAWTVIDTAILESFHAVHADRSGVFGVGGILSVSAEPRRGFVGRYGR